VCVKAAKECTRTIHTVVLLNTAAAGIDNEVLCAVLFCCVWCWQYHQLSDGPDRADRAVRHLLSPAHPKAIAPQVQACSCLCSLLLCQLMCMHMQRRCNSVLNCSCLKFKLIHVSHCCQLLLGLQSDLMLQPSSPRLPILTAPHFVAMLLQPLCLFPEHFCYTAEVPSQKLLVESWSLSFSTGGSIPSF